MQSANAFVLQPQLKEAEKLDVHQPSIVFTAEDLKTIKDYVRVAAGLPTSPHDIATSLGSSLAEMGSAIPDAIATLNTDIINHAATWPVLEACSSQLGIHLVSFADAFVARAQGIVKMIERTDAYQDFSARLSDVAELELEEPLTLTDRDTKATPTIMRFLESMKEQIADYQTRVTEVYELSTTFAQVLEYKLPQQLRNVHKAIDKKQIDEKLADYNAYIKELGEQIAEKTLEVDQYRSYTWYGALFGPLGLAVMHLTAGSEGREADEKRAALIERRDRAHAEVARLDPLNARLLRYQRLLDDTARGILDTQEAAQHLQHVWATIDAQVDASMSEARRIGSHTDLLLFMNSMAIIAKSWEKTLAQSRALNKVFEEFMEVYEHESAKGSVQ